MTDGISDSIGGKGEKRCWGCADMFNGWWGDRYCDFCAPDFKDRPTDLSEGLKTITRLSEESEGGYE